MQGLNGSMGTNGGPTNSGSQSGTNGGKMEGTSNNGSQSGSMGQNGRIIKQWWGQSGPMNQNGGPSNNGSQSDQWDKTEDHQIVVANRTGGDKNRTIK